MALWFPQATYVDIATVQTGVLLPAILLNMEISKNMELKNV